jgi:hypothetical protein
MSNGYDRLEAEWGFTDQEREHYDYEFNAHYDRFDGWADVDYSARFDYDSCETCGYAVPYCADCKAYRAELARVAELVREADTDYDGQVPF